jgi:hypothetical protein
MLLNSSKTAYFPAALLESIAKQNAQQAFRI